MKSDIKLFSSKESVVNCLTYQFLTPCTMELVFFINCLWKDCFSPSILLFVWPLSFPPRRNHPPNTTPPIIAEHKSQMAFASWNKADFITPPRQSIATDRAIDWRKRFLLSAFRAAPCSRNEGKPLMEALRMASSDGNQRLPLRRWWQNRQTRYKP